MPRKTTHAINIAKLQTETTKYVREYITTKPLGLPNLAEEDFTRVMDAITRAMSEAWAAGYMYRHEEK